MQDLPASPAVTAPRDARAGEMSRAPGAWGVLRRRHKNQLRIRRTKHEPVGVAADFVFPSGPLLPSGAAFGTDVKSPSGDRIETSGIARMNHQPVDVVIELGELLPALSSVGASLQPTDFNRRAYRRLITESAVVILHVADRRQ